MPFYSDCPNSTANEITGDTVLYIIIIGHETFKLRGAKWRDIVEHPADRNWNNSIEYWPVELPPEDSDTWNFMFVGNRLTHQQINIDEINQYFPGILATRPRHFGDLFYLRAAIDTMKQISFSSTISGVSHYVNWYINLLQGHPNNPQILQIQQQSKIIHSKVNNDKSSIFHNNARLLPATQKKGPSLEYDDDEDSADERTRVRFHTM